MHAKLLTDLLSSREQFPVGGKDRNLLARDHHCVEVITIEAAKEGSFNKAPRVK